MTYNPSIDDNSEKINNKKQLLEKRKYLRNNSSKAEIILWNYLKASQITNCKFRRQHSIANYILDFYCTSKRLGLELDGDSHFSEEAILYDTQRTELIEKYRIRILRFNNTRIYNDIENVLAEIRTYLN